MKRYIVSIDQSTSASKVFLVDSDGRIIRSISKKHAQYYPAQGWVEHDAAEIWQNVRQCVRDVIDSADGKIESIAISNQRETTVLWDRATGIPVARAVVWQDTRGATLCAEISEHSGYIADKTGLILSPYYPAAKAASVLRANPNLMQRAVAGEICIGTIDAYLVYRMTEGAVFKTDVSNASRTQLCDISALDWDAELCSIFGIPQICLPQIDRCDGDFGIWREFGVPITGVMGDSHASLFGNGCVEKGMVKATFGTGSSIMMNTGGDVVQSKNGLSASIGYGRDGSVNYVLEGNVNCSGDTLCWLRDEAKLVDSVDEAQRLAESVPSTDGVYLIPAFTGLGAPYFDSAARGAIIGMNRGTTRAHIARAAVESMAYQVADVIDAMARDMGAPVGQLMLDGGGSGNAMLVQLLCDLMGCTVKTLAQRELSGAGAAYMSGLSTGMFKSYADIPATRDDSITYFPNMSQAERTAAIAGWRAAVRRLM